MRLLLRVAGIASLACLVLQGAVPQLPEVQEHRLKNGIRVFLVERAGTGALHAGLWLRGGRSDTAGLPAVAADLLAQCLFGRPLPEDLGQGSLDAVLKQEEGAYEGLRLERRREDRSMGAAPSPESVELQEIQRSSAGQIATKVRAVEAWDALDSLGASGRCLEASADFVMEGLDLPTTSLKAWCQLEEARLGHLQLGRFPVERDRLLASQEAPDPLAILLGTALTGHAYAQVLDPKSLAPGVLWSELRGYAQWATAPERMVLVLVGDLDPAQTLPLLERTLGTLKAAAEAPGRREGLIADLPEAVGARRVLAGAKGPARIQVAWRVPPLSHPDTPYLAVMARILEDRLREILLARADELTVKLGVPGARDANLLVVEAHPLVGHSPAELEQTIQGQVMRLQQEILPEDEVRRAQQRLEMDQLLSQEDAATLAAMLGAAVCRGGDWKLAFGLARGEGAPEVFQAATRRYLVPAQCTSVSLEPDGLGGADALDARLIQALRSLMVRKSMDPAQAEALIRQTLLQIGTLPQNEREQMLHLLEAQGKRP